MGDEIRLQKYLAECGLGSRRRCEALIDSGVVTVDGVQVTVQGPDEEQSLTLYVYLAGSEGVAGGLSTEEGSEE